MQKKLFFVVLIILILFFFFSNHIDSYPRSAQKSTNQESLQHEVIVVLKLVQVYVTDKKGNPVIDLGKEDFILYEDGKAKTITDFERHVYLLPEEKADVKRVEKKEEVVPTPVPTVQPKLNRKFFLLIDYYRNDGRGVSRSKKAALHFIETQLRPTDEVAVLTYSYMKGLDIRQFLTTDHTKVQEVIKGIKRIPESIRWESEFMRQSAGSFRTLPSRGPIPEPMDPDTGSARTKTRIFTGTITELAKAFRYIPGYKNVIFFSSGIPRFILNDPDDPAARQNYQDMSVELASSGTPVYAVNTDDTTARISGSKDDWGDHSLRLLSDLSGGRYFGDVKEYEKISRDIQNITSNYYVLGYYIDEKWDGKYHEIKVKVRRPGCEVHTQGGYFNPEPFSELSEFEKQLQLIDLAFNKNPAYQNPERFHMAALPSSNKDELNLVLLSEIPVKRIKEVARGKAEIYTLIIDQNNGIADLRRGEFNLTSLSPAKVYHYTISSLAPGKYDCRVIIRNLKNGKGAVASSQVEISNPLSSGVRLDPPLLLVPGMEAHYLCSKKEEGKAESEILIVRKLNPFVSIDSSPIVRELNKGAPGILARVRCTHVGVEHPDVKFEVSLFHQESNQTIPIPLSVAASKKEGRADVVCLELQMPELQLGNYTLRIIAEAESTGAKSQTEASFAIR